MSLWFRRRLVPDLSSAPSRSPCSGSGDPRATPRGFPHTRRGPSGGSWRGSGRFEPRGPLSRRARARRLGQTLRLSTADTGRGVINDRHHGGRRPAPRSVLTRAVKAWLRHRHPIVELGEPVLDDDQPARRGVGRRLVPLQQQDASIRTDAEVAATRNVRLAEELDRRAPGRGQVAADRSEEMAADPQEILNGSVYREKPLRLGSGFESAHLALALPGRLVGHFRSIVRVLVRAVDHRRHHSAARRWVTAQFVGDQPSRDTALSFSTTSGRSAGPLAATARGCRSRRRLHRLPATGTAGAPGS